MGLVEEPVDKHEAVHEIIEGTDAGDGIGEVRLISCRFIVPGEESAQYGKYIVCPEFLDPGVDTCKFAIGHEDKGTEECDGVFGFGAAGGIGVGVPDEVIEPCQVGNKESDNVFGITQYRIKHIHFNV